MRCPECGAEMEAWAEEADSHDWIWRCPNPDCRNVMDPYEGRGRGTCE